MKTRRIEAVLLRVCESLKSAASRAGVGHWRLVEMSEKKRPTVVKILVLIVAIGSIIPILAGVMMLTGGAYEGYFMQELLSQILPIYYVLVGVIGLVAAWGLWIGRGWAWILALIIFIIGIIMDLVTLPTGIVGVVIDAIVLYLLMRPDTRRFCGK
jgi:hypothetical protein